MVFSQLKFSYNYYLLQHEEYDSPHLKVRAENDTMSDSESPVLRQPFAVSKKLLLIA